MTAAANKSTVLAAVVRQLDSLAPDRAPMTADDPASLGRRFATGELAAADEVVSEYYPRVTRTVQRLLGWHQAGETSDLAQEVFVRALASRHKFRGEADLPTWLTRIAINVVRGRQRQTQLRQLLFGIFAQGAHKQATHEPYDKHESLRDAVARLPPTFREVIVLHYLEELPVAEVARVLGLTPAAVNKRLARGRQRLHERLSQLNQT